ncbi:MAG: hypothetical protein DRI37_08945 [Chloroflexi bacterium]|nr:MAG: hypothetical protein DRI37_08945 [Chloroflexota bacterium]
MLELLSLIQTSWQGTVLTEEEWRSLFSVARRYRILSSLTCLLDEAKPPEELRHALRAAYYQVASLAVLREQVLLRVLGALEKAAIPVVLLKGAALAYTLYSDPACRPMGDFDLLVREEDLFRAATVLEGEGFTPDREAYGDPLQFAVVGSKQLPLRCGAAPVPVLVELHTDLIGLSWFRRCAHIELSEVWERTRPVEIKGRAARLLSLEDTLLHLSLHLALHHSFVHPTGYLDLLLLLRRHGEELNWEVVVRNARAYRLQVATWQTLELLKTAGVSIPEQVQRELRPSRWRRRVLAQLLLSPHVMREGKAPLRGEGKRFLGLLLVDDLVRLPAVIVKGMFPGRAWIAARYGLARPYEVTMRTLTYPLEVVLQGGRVLWGRKNKAAP